MAKIRILIYFGFCPCIKYYTKSLKFLNPKYNFTWSKLKSLLFGVFNMSNPIFNINYQRAYSSAIEFQTQINEKIKGREQRYPKWTYPKREFSLKFDKDPQTRTQLENFFDNVKGNVGVFDWTWDTEKGGNGQTYQCTFDLASLEQNLHHLGFTQCQLKLITIDKFPVSYPDNFDFFYKTDYKFSRIFNNLIDKVFTSQNNRRALWNIPKKSWTLSFEKDPETRKLIENFFIAKRGQFRSFLWTWDTSKGGDGQTYTVRFDTDKLDIDSFLGYSDNIQIPIKQVWPNPLTTPEFEKDEIIPRRLLLLNLSSGPVRILDNETLESLTYQGETYLGAPLEVGEISHIDNTQVAKLNVSVSNVGQGISGIIGQYGDTITGAECFLYQVLLDVNNNSIISGSDSILFAGKANNLHLDAYNASIDIETTLGGFELKTPKISYGVSCQWLKFKDNRCGYSGIEKNCDRTLETCKRYGNIERFGGFPSLPSEQIIKV